MSARSDFSALRQHLSETGQFGGRLDRTLAEIDRDEREALAIGIRHLLGENVAIPDLRALNSMLRSVLRKVESRS